MSNLKRERIAAAVTVNVILLIIILAAVIVYQLITLSVLSKKRDNLQAEIARYEQLIKQGEDDLEFLQSEQNLLELALQYGYKFPND